MRGASTCSPGARQSPLAGSTSRPPPDLRAATRTTSRHDALAGAYLHHIACYCRLRHGRHTAPARESAAFLIRAVRLRTRSPLARDSLADSDGGTSSDGDGNG